MPKPLTIMPHVYIATTHAGDAVDLIVVKLLSLWRCQLCDEILQFGAFVSI